MTQTTLNICVHNNAFSQTRRFSADTHIVSMDISLFLLKNLPHTDKKIWQNQRRKEATAGHIAKKSTQSQSNGFHRYAQRKSLRLRVLKDSQQHIFTNDREVINNTFRWHNSRKRERYPVNQQAFVVRSLFPWRPVNPSPPHCDDITRRQRDTSGLYQNTERRRTDRTKRRGYEVAQTQFSVSVKITWPVPPFKIREKAVGGGNKCHATGRWCPIKNSGSNFHRA